MAYEFKNEVEHQLTTADAIKMIKNAPNHSSFNLHVRVDLAIEGKPDRIYPGEGSTFLKLSRADALRIVSKLMREGVESQGGRIPIRTYEDTSSRRKKGEWVEITRRIYWIG